MVRRRCFFASFPAGAALSVSHSERYPQVVILNAAAVEKSAFTAIIAAMEAADSSTAACYCPAEAVVTVLASCFSATRAGTLNSSVMPKPGSSIALT